MRLLHVIQSESDFEFLNFFLATSWTETAHSNCSMCLGTIITEWKEGKIRCSKLLENIEAKTYQLSDFVYPNVYTIKDIF